MARLTKKALVEIGKELNEVMGLDPEIDVSLKVGELEKAVRTAADLVEKDDDLSATCITLLKKLIPNFWEEEPAKKKLVKYDEDEDEDKGKDKDDDDDEDEEEDEEDDDDEDEEEDDDDDDDDDDEDDDDEDDDDEDDNDDDDEDDDDDEKPVPVKKPVPTKKPVAKKKSGTGGVGKYQGAMTQYIDNLLLPGQAVTWDNLLKKTKKEAEKRGIDPGKYNLGTLKAHMKYRAKHGFPAGKGMLEIVETENTVQVIIE